MNDMTTQEDFCPQPFLPNWLRFRMFQRVPVGMPREWKKFFAWFYGAISLIFLFSGHWSFCIGFLVICTFFCLRSTNLDLFAPMAMVMHAFGLYFFVPIFFIPDRVPELMPLILGTLCITVVIYLLLPPLELGFGRALGKDLRLSKRFLRLVGVTQILGLCGFVLSTWLAGYSNPLAVFSDPLGYRFFMMMGGMTYFSEVLSFFIISPVLVCTIAYYRGLASGRVWLFSIIPALVYALATGARGTIVNVVFQVFVIRHLSGRQLRMHTLLTLVVTFVPLIAFLGEYRMAKYASENASVRSTISQLSLSDIGQIAFARLDAGVRFNELLTAFRQREPKMGLSYLQLPLQVIPRSMWEDKPRLPNPEMTRIIGRNDPYLDISFDFGIFGESYLNFGIMGVLWGAIVIAIVTGAFQCIYDYALRTHEPIVLIFCSFTFTLPFALVVSGLDEMIVYGSFEILKVIGLRYLFFRKAQIRSAQQHTPPV